jgi:two-component system, NtrC family, nitrogen regulation sensor histidine kinase NtrY
MVCRKFYFHIVVRVLLLVLTCLFLFYFVFYLPNISLLIITSSILVFQVTALIGYLNRINTKLENFFLAHLSGEVNTSFAGSKKQDEFFKLYDYFDELNQKLESIRLENEIQNNYFKTIVDQTSVGLISFTDEGLVEFINDAAKRILKVFVVRDLSRLDTFKEGFSKYLLELEPEKTELVPVVVDDEMIQLSVKKVDFKAGSKSLHLVSIQNIKEELDQKEIESWQKLIRVLTHEIMNSITPITSLVNTTSRIFRNKETGRIIKPAELTEQNIEKTVKGLDIVEGRGERLIQFVNNYRDLTKLPKPNFQTVFVKRIFQDVQELHQEQLAEKNIRVVIACHQSLQIQIDQKLFEQVMINLFKNAIEACAGKPSGVIKLSAQASNDHVIIEVEDNGRGIPPEVEQNMFVPFFTTKEKGSGIGLSLSRQFIRLHGGNLDFYSVPGEKTVFTIKL